jgi:hypothetical protein
VDCRARPAARLRASPRIVGGLARVLPLPRSAPPPAGSCGG